MELYHVLNRGVDKREIFMDDTDRLRFVLDLFEFNSEDSSDATYYHFHAALAHHDKFRDVGRPEIKRNRLVDIHAFAMMPNHYHLLLSPVAENGISLFMKKLGGGYAKYFNERHERSGALFQGKYKSVHINEERHFLYIPYYIHFNPLDLHAPKWRERSISNKRSAVEFLESYRWSSHLDYLGKKNFPSVTQRSFLLDYFGGTTGYTRASTSELKNFSVEALSNTTLE